MMWEKKYLLTGSGRQERCVLSHTLRVWYMVVGKSWREEFEAADLHRTLNHETERGQCWGYPNFSFWFSLGPQPRVRQIFPPQLNLSRNTLTDTTKCVSMGILCPTLAIKINQDRSLAQDNPPWLKSNSGKLFFSRLIWNCLYGFGFPLRKHMSSAPTIKRMTSKDPTSMGWRRTGMNIGAWRGPCKASSACFRRLQIWYFGCIQEAGR